MVLIFSASLQGKKHFFSSPSQKTTKCISCLFWEPVGSSLARAQLSACSTSSWQSLKLSCSLSPFTSPEVQGAHGCAVLCLLRFSCLVDSLRPYKQAGDVLVPPHTRSLSIISAWLKELCTCLPLGHGEFDTGFLFFCCRPRICQRSRTTTS